MDKEMEWCRKSPEIKIGDYGSWFAGLVTCYRVVGSSKVSVPNTDNFFWVTSDGRKDLGLEGCSKALGETLNQMKDRS